MTVINNEFGQIVSNFNNTVSDVESVVNPLRWGDSERATDLELSRILAANWQHGFVNFSGPENCLI